MLWAGQFFGMPYPLLSGILASILRFIPYVGTWLSTGLILLLSVAVTLTRTLPLVSVACLYRGIGNVDGLRRRNVDFWPQHLGLAARADRLPGLWQFLHHLCW